MEQLPTAAAPVTFVGLSPEGAIPANLVESDWIAKADPSLHVFFDDVDNIDNLFQGLQGFPNTVEHDDFSYMTSGINTMRGASFSQKAWPNSQIGFDQYNP